MPQKSADINLAPIPLQSMLNPVSRDVDQHNVKQRLHTQGHYFSEERA